MCQNKLNKNKHSLSLISIIISIILIFSTISYTTGNQVNIIVDIFNNSRNDTYLSIVPSSQTVVCGETFNIIVYVDPGEPIMGIQIDLSFNPSLIHAVSVSNANPDVWNFFGPPTINNTIGMIKGAGVAILGGNVTMPTDCFNITFTAQNTPGTSPLTLQNVSVVNESVKPVDSLIINNGQVTVSGTANLPPVFGAPFPANGSTDQPLSFTWSIPISDPDGDLFTWSIECSNGQFNSGAGATNGTKSLVLSGLAYSSTYIVWVNATDPGGSGQFTRAWYTFTTQQQNLPPNPPSDPSPSNGSTNVDVNADLSWSCSDPDDDPLTFDVYFGTTNPPPKVVSNQSSTSYDPGTMNYETVYYWKVVAWDNHNVSSSGDVWHFTTIADKVPPIVKITQPQLGFIYFYFIVQWRLRIYPTDSTLVIGKIDIKADAIDNVGVSWVKFYINDTLKLTCYEPPYIYSWNELTYYDLYKIKVVASDYSGNIKSEEVAVWKFQLFEVSE